MFAFLRRNPALWTGALFALGIALSFRFLAEISPAVVWLILAAAFSLMLLTRKHDRAFLLFTGFAFFISGWIYGYQHFAYHPPDHLLNLPEKQVKGIQGYVSEAVIRKNGKHRYVLQCDRALLYGHWQKAQGKVLLLTQKGLRPFHYGQRLQIHGRLEPPSLPVNPGQFNYRRYLNLKGIFFQMYAAKDSLHIFPGVRGSPIERLILEPVRQHIRRNFDHYLPPPVAAMVKALILGERQDLDRNIVNQFQKTGVVHVLAISGLHVGFVLLIFLIFFGFFPLSYKMRYLFTFIALGFFVALVNFKAPVVRASLMAAFYFAVSLSQRKASALNILAAAGFLILLIDPSQILQPGFQFSFAAVGGIVYGYPHLKALFPLRFGKGRLPQGINRWAWQPMLVSLSAVLATMPLTWYYYGTLQIGAVIINLLIIPLIGVLVVLSLLFVILSVAAFPFLGGLALLITWLVQVILSSIAFFSRFGWVQMSLRHPSLWIVALTFLLIIFLFRMHEKRSLIYAAILLGIILVLRQSNRLHGLRATFIDVGQGDACLIQLPNNMNVLIDAGDRNRWRDYGAQSVVPVCRYFGVKHLRYAVATHPHSDHYGGLLTVMRSVKIDTLVVSPYPDSSKGYLRLLRQVAKTGIPVRRVQRGQKLNFGPSARAYVLSPVAKFEKVRAHNGHEINNSSIVLRLCYGNNAFLLTGDAQKEAENVIDSYGNFLRSNVLKVGHHGSSTSSTPEFLNLVQPDFAIISVGKRNKFHHPSPKTLRTLRLFRIPAFRTDHFGAIMFESDGQKVRLVNWRK